jgi:TrmH family RNA methyltransferase
MKIDEVRKLQQRKHREETGLFLVEGEHPVQELLKVLDEEPRLRASTLYCTREYATFTAALPVQVVNPKQMAQICETRTPQGIVAVAPILPPPLPRAGERAIYLHGLQDPGNLGTILRTLAWFGDFRCLLGPGSVDVHNGKVVRASMGAIFHVPVEADVPVESLPARFGRIACLDLTGTPIANPDFHQHDCFVYGSEAHGLPVEFSAGIKATRFSIAGEAAIDSLNVAMAVAISQYELHRAPG